MKRAKAKRKAYERVCWAVIATMPSGGDMLLWEYQTEAEAKRHIEQLQSANVKHNRRVARLVTRESKGAQ